ncbi:MAG: enoyl-CoA hydratase-related protein [Myxococcales bacterium]|nr:enoyl-CoA hydratase-related protein [Myxococcales bacterium]
MTEAMGDLAFESNGGVAVLTLNRPEQLNAFTGAMGASLEQAYRRCDEDDDVRAVVLTGAGRAFCAGADMAAAGETFGEPGAEFSAAAVGVPAWTVRKPVIAALNGHAIGLGLTLALQADIRFLAREGKYGVLQVRRGVMPDAYAHWTLPRIVGLSRAAEILLSGRRYSGEEAFALGLGSRLLPAEEVLPAALELARKIAENTAPVSVAVTKRLLWESSMLTPEQVEHRETELHRHLMGKADALEGPLAWLERRPPNFTLSVSGDFPPWPEDDGESA